ncbi:hypothetical protein BG015_007070, partial [Linnemannia schmuckeri]
AAVIVAKAGALTTSAVARVKRGAMVDAARTATMASVAAAASKLLWTARQVPLPVGSHPPALHVRIHTARILNSGTRIRIAFMIKLL